MGSNGNNICDNPKCEHHKPSPHLNPQTGYVDVPNGDKRVQVHQHWYVSSSGKELFLCSVCHSAAQLVINTLIRS